MSRDRFYKPGDNYILSDLSGFKIRSSQARVIPGGITGGLAVASWEWEPQQPQDFVTGVREDMYVELARPRQENRFTITGTFIVSPSAAQSNTITVDSSLGFSVGAPVQIMLDTGVNFQVLIAAISGNTWTLGDRLPASVGMLYGDPIENSILLLTNSPVAGTFVLDSANAILNVNILA